MVPLGVAGRKKPSAVSPGNRMIAGFAAAYVALLPVQFQLAPKFRLAASDLVLAAGLVIWGYRLTVSRSMVSFWHGLLVMLFAGTSMATLARFGELSTWGLVNKTFGFLALLAAYLMIGHLVDSWESLLRIVHVLVASVAMFNVISVLTFLGGIEIATFNSSPELSRLAGGLVDPNAYGGLLAMCLLAYAGLRRTPYRQFGPWLDRLVIVSLVLGIVLTLSRSTWLSLGAGLLVLVVLNRELRPAVGWSVLAVLLAVFGFFFLDSGARVAELTLRFDTIEGRIALNQAALQEATAHPLGLGLGGFEETYGAIVHNTPLWFAVDLGLIGLAVFLGFSFWVLQRLLVAYSMRSGAERAVIVGLGLAHLAMLVLSLTMEAFYQRHWWVVMALIAAAARPRTLAASNSESGP